VQTLVADMNYASQEEVDTVLWQMHSYINSRFRRTIKELQSPHQAVVKRKVEKMYLEFLRTSQYFYRGFLQRLCAHYKISRLEQLAQSLQLEAPQSTTDQSANESTVDNISGLVLAVCHRLLVALGDLARYKGQVRRQSHTSSMALSYYALANDLLPASGWGHHQIGVIHLDDKNHFGILYHFFRAWAAELPHPNAASNLDLELRELLQPAAPRSHLAPDVLKTRFVWLQALFNRGEPFRQREELEKEVLSRFKTALNNRENGDILLQVLLVNACSYQYALERVQGERLSYFKHTPQ
jgi:protein SMG7